MPPIMIPAQQAPSLLEARSLARTVRPTHALTRSPSHILEQFLTLLTNPDVQSFLFSPDALHVPHLTSPAFLHSCITGSLKYLRVEPSSRRPVGPLSESVFGKYVFSPMFTVAGVTLGFGMNEYNYLRGDEWGGDSMMHMRTCNRFVRNDARMELLIMQDIPDFNAVCMEYSRTITPTTQYRASICFHRDKLYEANHLGLSAHNLIASIDQLCSMYEYRDCPICSRHHHACRCTLSTLSPQKPRHPLDHHAFATNMASRLGTWTGTMNVSIFEYGRFQRQSLVANRNVYTGGLDLQLILSMRAWCLAQLNGSESPLQTILAPPHQQQQQQQHTNTTTTTDQLQLVTPTVQPSPSAQPLNPYYPFDDPTSFLDVYDEETDPDLSPLNEFPPLSEIADDLFLNSSTICPSSSSPLSPSHHHISPELAQSVASRARAHTIQPLIDLSVQPDTITTTSALDDTATSNASSNDAVRQLKAEMRKQRNRIAAKKSNLKKKIQNEKLKCDLQQTREKASLLRGKESSLRSENLLLRRLLAETTTTTTTTVGQS